MYAFVSLSNEADKSERKSFKQILPRRLIGFVNITSGLQIDIVIASIGVSSSSQFFLVRNKLKLRRQLSSHAGCSQIELSRSFFARRTLPKVILCFSTRGADVFYSRALGIYEFISRNIRKKIVFSMVTGAT